MNWKRKLKRQRHLRRRAKRQLRAREAFRKYRKEKNLEQDRSIYSNDYSRVHQRKKILIRAPQKLSLFDHYLETNEFLTVLTQKLNKGRAIFVDLSLVEFIGVETILVLISLIKNNGTNKRRKAGISGNAPKQQTQAFQLLYDSGFYEEFNSSFPVREQHQRKGNIEHRKGEKVSVDIAAKLVKEANLSILGKECYPPEIYRILIEAMGNTREHANPSQQALENWWTMLYTEKNDKRASFVFYDGGVGILKSLRNKLKSFFDTLIGVKDEDVFHDLMEGKGSNRSRTKLPFRGKGLPAMTKAFERKHIKNLRIISNNISAYVDKKQFIQVEKEFKGTLLYWEINYDA